MLLVGIENQVADKDGIPGLVLTCGQCVRIRSDYTSSEETRPLTTQGPRFSTLGLAGIIVAHSKGSGEAPHGCYSAPREELGSAKCRDTGQRPDGRRGGESPRRCDSRSEGGAPERIPRSNPISNLSGPAYMGQGRHAHKLCFMAVHGEVRQPREGISYGL